MMIKELKDKIQNLKKMNYKNFFLFGEFGSGKTTFVKYYSNLDIISPTYNLYYSYDYENSKLYHFDLYRDKTFSMKNVILEAYLNDYWIFIEWPHLLDFKLENSVSLYFTKFNIEIKEMI